MPSVSAKGCFYALCSGHDAVQKKDIRLNSFLFAPLKMCQNSYKVPDNILSVSSMAVFAAVELLCVGIV